MFEPKNVTYERVDDLPLLLEQQKRMGVQKLLDKNFSTHGNWQGLTLGWVASIWLGYILSQVDHRLSYVQAWAEKRLSTLRVIVHSPPKSDLEENATRSLATRLIWPGFSNFERQIFQQSNGCQLFDWVYCQELTAHRK